MPTKYYPALSSVVTLDDFPEYLGFIKTGIQQIFDKIYIKDFQAHISPRGESGFYGLSIVSKRRLQFQIPGTEMYLILNPDNDDTNISSFPVTVEYQWLILAYLSSFDLDNFSFSAREFFELGLEVLNVSEEEVISLMINNFVNPADSSRSNVEQFVIDINEKHDLNIPIPTSNNKPKELVLAIKNQFADEASLAVFLLYLFEEADLAASLENVKAFFKRIIPEDIDGYIKNVITPKARVTLALSAAIEFPTTILKPINGDGSAYVDPMNPNVKTQFRFAQALLYADTQEGFGYQMELGGSLFPPYAEIGKTGMILQVESLKLDLSTTSNITEADADGRPDDFIGVYARALSVTLPTKWFHDDTEPVGTTSATLRLGAYDLLVGSGGVSGTIMLETVPLVNPGSGFNYFNTSFDFVYPVVLTEKDTATQVVKDKVISNYAELISYLQVLNAANANIPYPFKFPLSLIPIGTTDILQFLNQKQFQSYLASIRDENTILWKRLGGENGFRVGFKRFDITFQQNVVVESNIEGRLRIPKLRDTAGNPSEIFVWGHLQENGDFHLTASEPEGIKCNLFNLIEVTFQSVELGKENDVFFIGADTKLSFPEGSLANNLFNGQVIDIPALRFYFDGRFEVVGGNSFIPVNFTLPLFGDSDNDGKGNFEMSVTGIHLGSIQRERNGKTRKYNYIGFDGGISIDPIGVDLRGKGVKYYYTTDSDEIFEEFGATEGHDEAYYRDSYFHISTLELDLIIPGNAQPKDALAIIKGSLTIPEPGVSTEYSGKISIQIPKGNIYGEAAMRLDPKTPAYLINAHVEFPNGIPLGPVAINGFKGLLGQRYVAEKRAIGMGEENTWYEYYMAPQKGINVDKFSGPELTKDYESAFSIGLGAKISTNDGGGRIASLRAMMLLSTPSMFAIDAGLTILSERLGLAEEDPTNPPFYAFVIIGDDALELGAGAKFKLNKSNGYLLDIKAELQAGFFFKNQRPWYVNFGTPQQPIVAKLFKGVIGINAYSYLMISARGIEAGARASFQFNFIIAKFKASIEVGAYISFERPQIGAYALLQGSIKIKFGPFKLTTELKVYLAVEMPKPFLIFAEFRLRVCARISFVKVCIRLKFTLKWKKNNTMVYTPIPPLSYQNLPDDDFAKIEQHLKRVKGVNMLTYEEFDLHFLGVNLIASPDAEVIDKIIPLDTYVDIKVEKGLDPMALQPYKIGGHTGGAVNFVDLIPPRRQLKGGKTIRQVKHKYSIKSLEIFAWVEPTGGSPGSWVPYHPFKALLPNSPVDNFKIGYWQRSGKQYDTIRLLATNPFSFLDGAEPGWFIPEQYGITPSELFCTSSDEQWNCADVLEYPLNAVYSPDNDPNFAYNFDGAYFYLKGPHEDTLDPITGEVIGESFGDMIVQDVENPHSFPQSLVFRNSETLVIKLPEPSVRVKLKITTNSQGVTIKYYRTAIDDDSMFQTFELIESVHKTAAELEVEIDFDNETNYDPLKSVFKVEITPDFPNQNQILAIETQMEELWVNNQEAADGPTISVLSPADQMLYDQLNTQLNQLKAVGCSGNIGSAPCNKDELLCGLYSDIKLLFDDCFHPLTVETVYDYCNELDCFNNFVLKIKIFDQNNPLYSLLEGTLHDAYIELLDRLSQLQSWCQNQNNNFPQVFEYYSAFVNIAQDIVTKVEEIGNCDCNGGNGCNEDELLCELYDYLQNALESCFTPLSVNNIYQYCDEMECFESFIKKISLFNDDNPSYGLLQGVILNLYDDYKTYLQQLQIWCGNPNQDQENVFNYYTTFVEIATNLSSAIGDKGHCNCGENGPCQKDELLCDLYATLLALYNDCFIPLPDKEEYIYCQELSCFNQFINLIKDFNNEHTEYLLVANHLNYEYGLYEEQINQLTNWCSNQNPDTSAVRDYYESFVSNAFNIVTIIGNLGNCNCVDGSGLNCTTSFQEVCWKTLEHYEYSQTIPSQASVEEDTNTMIAGINTTAQPIWRPNTKYYIKFSLKDEVDNGQRPAGTFDYYYGFRTVGPVGHFHKYPNAYPIPETVVVDGVTIQQSVEEFPLTSLRKYIDYNRSYPNADGNIILAKPLFYGNEQCKIDIYFEKPFAYHMLKTWEAYNGMPELKGAMHIAIKDPISNVIIPYPLPEDWEVNEYVPETILNGDDGWVSDEDPRLPLNIQILNNYVNNVNSNPDSIECTINLGDPIKPASYTYSVTLTNLKPRKLYTAIVYNAFDENGDGLFENQLDENNGIVYEESQKVHEFVFQTSRYQTFREQVESYLLKEFDENNNLINEKQAVYEHRLTLSLDQVDNAFALVSGGNTPETLAMETQFYHPFDRVIEGVFGIKPIDPAVTTDFIRIVDENTGKIVAFIIRNPEPFNNPRIPLNEIAGTVFVHPKLSVNPDTNYKVLYSKDYSQMIVMHVNKEIVSTTLRIIFKYKIWSGSEYIVPDESFISDDEKIYTIKTVIQIKQN